MDVADLGWDDDWAAALAEHPGLTAARVSIEHRGAVEVMDADGSFWAEVTGKMFFAAGDKRELPAVGDWVALDGAEAARASGARARLLAILPRRSCLIRRAAGEKEVPQTIAANVDVAFIVTSANQDLNLRRLERYLIAVRDGGATPVVAINKADLIADPGPVRAAVIAVAGGAEVIALSARRGDGVETLAAFLGRGRTAVVIGSSGVGKSTIVNALAGTSTQVTQSVRGDDDKGRHTTTRRELFVLPLGGVLIDTPGMRELQLWSPDDEPDFDDVTTIAAGCRFADCRHRKEPGCAVVAAVAAGTLVADRLASYRKLADELAAREQREREGTRVPRRRR